MPNRPAHLALGTGAGALAAGASVAFRYKRRPEAPRRLLHDIAQVGGGALAGRYAGALPDIIEPAIHPNHRGFGHSAVVGGGVASLSFVERLREWEDGCRDRAEGFRGRRLEECHAFQQSNGGDACRHFLRAAWFFLCEMFWAALAGVPVGAAAGYVSHIVADATTPKGVPMVGLRF